MKLKEYDKIKNKALYAEKNELETSSTSTNQNTSISKNYETKAITLSTNDNSFSNISLSQNPSPSLAVFPQNFDSNHSQKSNDHIQIKTMENTYDGRKSEKSRTSKSSTKSSENIHKNHRQRLKSQFLQNGISSLTDIQKLELLLFFAQPLKDTNPIAHKLINEFGSLQDVFNADISKLTCVEGVKENSALLIKLVSELHPLLSVKIELEKINSATAAKQFCKQLYVGVQVEQFYVICLTKNNKIKKCKLIQSGSADEITVQIRSITEFALENKCTRIIVSHNHPNGTAEMSDEDCSFTYSLICSCLLNSIELIDHIIISPDDATSLASKKILPKLKETAFHALSETVKNKNLLSSDSSQYELE